jgi:Holliday junction resolvase
MSNPAKQKGDRLERAVTSLFNASSIKAQKVPLSGAIATHPGDVNIWLDGKKWVLECKSRKEFKTLYGWLENRDALILKGDRQPALMVLPLERFLELIADQTELDDARGEP